MTRAMRLAELLPDVAGVPDDLVITGLVQDSRALQPGDAFVAIGPVANDMTLHGLRFAAQAQTAGASRSCSNRRRRTGCPRPRARSRFPHCRRASAPSPIISTGIRRAR